MRWNDAINCQRWNKSIIIIHTSNFSTMYYIACVYSTTILIYSQQTVHMNDYERNLELLSQHREPDRRGSPRSEDR